MARLTVFFFVVVLGVGGTMAWWFDATRASDTTDTTQIPFAITSGQGVRAIASDLAEKKLIRSPTAFFVLVKLIGIEKNLQAGEFTLTRAMDMQTIARQLMHGYNDVEVRTLEGWRNKEIAQELSVKLKIPEEEFLREAKEGYMFPQTYSLPKDATSGAVIEVFTKEFNKQITAQMRADIKAKGMTLDQVIILASIVEREGNSDADRPIIASVLLNRLKAGMPLQADATVQYALDRYDYKNKTWWKKELTVDDLKVKSPYNTYLTPGLPPGPISNPGIKSIEAVIYPKNTDYLFYLHDAKGAVHVAKTIEEHNANIAKYLQ